jgi:small nuclear ribonucleoprotein (snRNP)-like protein
MDKRISIMIQGGRRVSGVLRGFDIFLNLVVDDAFEEQNAVEKRPIGMVVSPRFCPLTRRVEIGESGARRHG